MDTIDGITLEQVKKEIDDINVLGDAIYLAKAKYIGVSIPKAYQNQQYHYILIIDYKSDIENEPSAMQFSVLPAPGSKIYYKSIKYRNLKHLLHHWKGIELI